MGFITQNAKKNGQKGMDTKKGNLWTSKACKVSMDSPGPKDWNRGLHREGQQFFMQEKLEKEDIQLFPL